EELAVDVDAGTAHAWSDECQPGDRGPTEADGRRGSHPPGLRIRAERRLARGTSTQLVVHDGVVRQYVAGRGVDPESVDGDQAADRHGLPLPRLGRDGDGVRSFDEIAVVVDDAVPHGRSGPVDLVDQDAVDANRRQAPIGTVDGEELDAVPGERERRPGEASVLSDELPTECRIL